VKRSTNGLMHEVGFGIPVMPQGAFYVFADASRWTDDSCAYAFAFVLREKAGAGVPAKRVGRRAWTSGKRGRER
jgi:aspartate/methionine/tyrosine aminotransferase